MGKLDYAQCPNCDKIAQGESEVIKKFGIRNNSGYTMIQSWCKECRSSGN